MNRSTSLMTLVLVVAVTVFAGTAQAQNLLVNGNFATGRLAPWVPFTTSNGTNGNGGHYPRVVMLNAMGAGVVYAAHFSVGVVDPFLCQFCSEGGGINQIVLVSTAGTYNFFADIGTASVAFNADAGTFSIVIDGATLASKSLGSIGANQVLRGTLSGSVSLAAGSHTFEVLITRAYTAIAITPNELVGNIWLSKI
jgi:hypothetical protein